MYISLKILFIMIRNFCNEADFTLYLLICKFVCDICKETEEGICQKILKMDFLNTYIWKIRSLGLYEIKNGENITWDVHGKETLSVQLTATGFEPTTTYFLTEHSTIWPN